ATAEEAARFRLVAYEVSNYAAPGAESRHNLAYWRYADYAGIGPGAHGRISRDGALFATRRHRAPEAWAERVERDGHGTTDETGLRLAEGIDEARFAARTGVALDDAVDQDILRQAIEAGYVTRADGRLTASS